MKPPLVNQQSAIAPLIHDTAATMRESRLASLASLASLANLC